MSPNPTTSALPPSEALSTGNSNAPSEFITRQDLEAAFQAHTEQLRGILGNLTLGPPRTRSGRPTFQGWQPRRNNSRRPNVPDSEERTSALDPDQVQVPISDDIENHLVEDNLPEDPLNDEEDFHYEDALEREPSNDPTVQASTGIMRTYVHPFHGDSDIEIWIISFNIATHGYSEQNKFRQLVAAMRGNAYKWLIGQIRYNGTRSVRYWLEMLRRHFSWKENDIMREIKQVRWKEGDNSRPFIKNLQSQILEVRPNINNAELMDLMENALSTHPKFHELCHPSFPLLLPELLTKMDKVEASSSHASSVFNLDTKFYAIVKKAIAEANAESNSRRNNSSNHHTNSFQRNNSFQKRNESPRSNGNFGIIKYKHLL